jgi:hypothetical protein
MTKPINFPGHKQERRLRALRRLQASLGVVPVISKLTYQERRKLADRLTIICGEHTHDHSVRTKKNRAGFARFARA